MNYKLSISAFTKDYPNQSTATDAAKQLLSAGVWGIETGFKKVVRGEAPYLRVKNQVITFKTFEQLNYSMKLLAAISKNTSPISFTAKTDF